MPDQAPGPPAPQEESARLACLRQRIPLGQFSQNPPSPGCDVSSRWRPLHWPRPTPGCELPLAQVNCETPLRRPWTNPACSSSISVTDQVFLDAHVYAAVCAGVGGAHQATPRTPAPATGLNPCGLAHVSPLRSYRKREFDRGSRRS